MKSSKKNFLYTLAFGLLLGTANPQPLQAQTASPAIMQMAQSELQKRGLTEAEVQTRLLQKGIDVSNIAPADYPKYQAQVMAVLNELEAEKNKKATNTTPISINIGTTTPAAGTLPTLTGSQGVDVPAEPQTTPEEAAAEAELRVNQAAAAKTASNIYGHSIFTDHSLDVYRTTDGAQAPDTYILGAGDEVHITIFGASQTDIQQRITNEGYIHPSGVARIFLKGLTLAQARNVIRQSLSNSYLFRADQLAVTIVTARTVLVNVFGEAKVTGGFTLSALNSALNALSAAGGPTSMGSVRAIQLIRGENKKTIDVYDFMRDPSAQFKLDLQNNDILFVPVAKKLVRIEGAVKRPMRYEMLDGETVTDLIKFSGGLTMDVFPEFLQVQRYINGEEKLFEYKLSDILSGRTKLNMVDGDVVRIKTINKPMENFVEVKGSVYYPGRYDLQSNNLLSSVLANAKPNFEAKTDLLFVERLRPDQTVEFLTVPFPKFEGAPDFTLQSRDVIHIMSLTQYRDVASITVNGQVRNPFSRTFALNDRLTIGKAIDYAGGLKESVYPVAYIFRRNLFNPKEIKYIRIELDKDKETLLQPGDALNIYDNTTYSNVGELRISGAVKNPSGYTFDPTMTLHDLIINAGGFTVGAAFNRVEVFRTILSPTEKPQLQLITLSVDSAYNVVGKEPFALQPYDKVVVRMTPEFTMGRMVELNGQVRYPGVYVLESKESTLADVIKKAGGLLRDADPYGAQLFRTYNNRGNISIHAKKAIRRPNSKVHNPILFEGDVININRMENTVSILENGTRMDQYAAVGLRNDSIKNIVFQGKRSAAWYVRNFAGGFQKNADRMSITVTYPNNQMQGTKRFLGIFRNYPTVQPGATIALRLDAEKVKKDTEPKEKMDFETTVSKTLSVLTSTLSIILLVKSLNN